MASSRHEKDLRHKFLRGLGEAAQETSKRHFERIHHDRYVRSIALMAIHAPTKAITSSTAASKIPQIGDETVKKIHDMSRRSTSEIPDRAPTRGKYSSSSASILVTLYKFACKQRDLGNLTEIGSGTSGTPCVELSQCETCNKKRCICAPGEGEAIYKRALMPMRLLISTAGDIYEPHIPTLRFKNVEACSQSQLDTNPEFQP